MARVGSCEERYYEFCLARSLVAIKILLREAVEEYALSHFSEEVSE